MGGAWRGQRLGVVHVAGATLGLMAVVCVVWADVEGAPTDGNLISYKYFISAKVCEDVCKFFQKRCI